MAQRFIGIDPAQRYYCVGEIEFTPYEPATLVAMEEARVVAANAAIDKEEAEAAVLTVDANGNQRMVMPAGHRRRKPTLAERLPLTYGKLRVLSWRLWDLAHDRTCMTYDASSVPGGPALVDIDEKTLKIPASGRPGHVQRACERSLGAKLAAECPAVERGAAPVIIEQSAGTFDEVPNNTRLAAVSEGVITALDTVRQTTAATGRPRIIEMRSKKFGVARNTAAVKRRRAAAAAAAPDDGAADAATPKKKRRRSVAKKEVDEDVPTTYDERKDVSDDRVYVRLKADGDIYAVDVYDRIAALLAENPRLHLKTADMSDAVGLALQQAEAAAEDTWKHIRSDYIYS